MTPITAFCVCVDYLDILKLTLPYNAHQFEKINFITSPNDAERLQKYLWDDFHPQPGVRCASLGIFVTDLFYRDGAKFNKWAALEWGLDQVGREGWICLLDADVVWPKAAWSQLLNLKEGNLYTPRRRMCVDIPKDEASIPNEREWKNYPLHRNDAEFAGYSQIFHASDPVLGPPPWHETDWIHAGGADSFFQFKWKPDKKIRPGFEVLHLGEAGVNWMGRASPYADGSQPYKSKELKEDMLKMWRARLGKHGPKKFDPEKIKK